MTYGTFTVECTRDYTPAEVAEAIADVSDSLELHYIDALSRAQANFVDVATKESWTHLTFFEKAVTGMVLTAERSGRDAPYTVLFRTEVAPELEDTAERRVAIGELARRVVDRACAKLDMSLVSVEPAA
jgi:hypothetical protein